MKINRQSAGKTKALAYITGVYLGDGYLGRIKRPHGYDYRFTLNTIDYDFAKKTRDDLKKLFNRKAKIYTYPVKKSSKPNNQITLSNVPELFFLKKHSENRNKIPEFIYLIDRDAQKEFIAGIMDSEGYIYQNKWTTRRDGKVWTGYRWMLGIKCCDGFIDEFAHFLRKFGVWVGKRLEENPYKDGYKIPIRYHINKESFANNCYFHIKRKQKRLDAFVSSETICCPSKKG